VAGKPVLDYLYVVLISREISIQAKHQSKQRQADTELQGIEGAVTRSGLRPLEISKLQPLK